MTEPKVVRYDFRGNLADPGEGVFVHLNDYEELAARLAARVEELEESMTARENMVYSAEAANKRLREALEVIASNVVNPDDCCLVAREALKEKPEAPSRSPGHD